MTPILQVPPQHHLARSNHRQRCTSPNSPRPKIHRDRTFGLVLFGSMDEWLPTALPCLGAREAGGEGGTRKRSDSCSCEQTSGNTAEFGWGGLQIHVIYIYIYLIYTLYIFVICTYIFYICSLQNPRSSDGPRSSFVPGTSGTG